jgi:hypothetical protein
MTTPKVAVAVTLLCLLLNPTFAQEPNSHLATTISEQPLHPRITGAWRLVSIYEEDESGEDIDIFGTNPQGQFIATSSGQFSFQIVSGDGRRLAARQQVVTVSEARVGLREALTYFGTYSLDERTGALNFHISYCLFRSCDGTTRKASVEFVDGKLVFTSVVEPSPTGSFYSRLIWAREQ